MSVTTYTAWFRHPDGRRFVGSIHWDKDSPNIHFADLRPHHNDNTTGMAWWMGSSDHRDSRNLRYRLKTHAKDVGLQLVAEVFPRIKQLTNETTPSTNPTP